MKNLICICFTIILLSCNNFNQQTHDNDFANNNVDIDLFNEIIDEKLSDNASDFESFIDSFYHYEEFQKKNIVANLKGKYMFIDYYNDSIIFRENNWDQHLNELSFFLQPNLFKYYPNLIDTLIKIDYNQILHYQYIEESGTYIKKYFCKDESVNATFKLVECVVSTM